MSNVFSRRTFVRGVCAGAAGLPAFLGSTAALARNGSALQELRGNHFQLRIGYQEVNLTGRDRLATTINGSLPGPTLRWREGDTVTLDVSNALAEDTSLHWHGIILPTEMDGVPHLSFPGIKPGETFRYQFKVQQSGTYWYHSHSGYQEQSGVYGAIVIDPATAETSAERDYVVLLSDWSDTAPERIFATLKKMSHYYNPRERTAGDVWRDIQRQGVARTWRERSMWNTMRMNDRDIADVTGLTYTYLMNGFTPAQGWTGLFQPGEKIRLRFINGSAMTLFDVRIPGLTMTVVAADGQEIEPVTVDEFRIGVAETYDVIVTPEADSAYTVFAQSMDRSGYTWGTLTPDISLRAPIPAMDHAPVLSHRDMGMAHSDHGEHAAALPAKLPKSHAQQQKSPPTMSHHHHEAHTQTQHSSPEQHSAQHHGQTHDAAAENCLPAHAAMGHCRPAALVPLIQHAKSEFGPHVDMRAEAPQSGLQDPGVGLREHQQRYGRKVLRYADIKNRYPTRDRREPTREIQLHLTGNMSRYMWSIDGIKFADAEPLRWRFGERLRITLVNDTMMTHPMHLHGMWSELESGDNDYLPRKHTLLVQPGSMISYQVSADALGRWAYHCHLLYHMSGMMREVQVVS